MVPSPPRHTRKSDCLISVRTWSRDPAKTFFPRFLSQVVREAASRRAPGFFWLMTRPTFSMEGFNEECLRDQAGGFPAKCARRFFQPKGRICEEENPGFRVR